jgi:predicted  nucleic acid-binding Zn-ribbon protein
LVFALELTLNPQYEILKSIHQVDSDAGLAKADLKKSHDHYLELTQKIRDNEDLLVRSKRDMGFLETEIRRTYKRMDEIFEQKGERSARIFVAKTDDEHRFLKREIDNFDKEYKESQRKIEETITQVEYLKKIIFDTQKQIQDMNSQIKGDVEAIHKKEAESHTRLEELSQIRKTHVDNLEGHLHQHYERVFKMTKNPQGPITYVKDRACGNCRVGLSPQLLNNILNGSQVQFCPHCHHILLPQETALSS